MSIFQVLLIRSTGITFSYEFWMYWQYNLDMKWGSGHLKSEPSSGSKLVLRTVFLKNFFWLRRIDWLRRQAANSQSDTYTIWRWGINEDLGSKFIQIGWVKPLLWINTFWENFFDALFWFAPNVNIDRVPYFHQ